MPNERFREVAGAAAPSVDGRGKTGGQHSDKAMRDSWGQRRVPVCNRKNLTPIWRDWVGPGLKKTPVTYSGLRKPVWEMAGKSLHRVLPCSGTWMSRSLFRELSSGEHRL